MSFVKTVSALALASFLAACGGNGEVDLSSSLKELQSTSVLYFGLSGNEVACRKPKMTFGRREGDAFRIVNLGRQGFTHKKSFVRFRAPAGTYALLSITCPVSGGTQTLGIDKVGKQKGLYRSGLAQFTLASGENINGGVLTTAVPKTNFVLKIRSAIALIVPMSSAKKVELQRVFPDAKNITSDRLLSLKTRSPAEQAYKACVSNWIRSTGKSTKEETTTQLKKCMALDPIKN